MSELNLDGSAGFIGPSIPSNTFVWNRGDSYIVKDVIKTKQPTKSKVKGTYNNKHFKASPYSHEQIVQICEEHLIKGRHQKDVCEEYGLSKSTLQRWILDGGSYARAKQELSK